MTERIGFAAVIALITACAHPSAPDSTAIAAAPRAYTLTNLHPDPVKGYFYTSNYQLAGLIPRCTEVAMGERSSRELAFTVVSTGARYLYRLAPAQTPEGLDANIAKYFGSSCDPAATQGMTSIDRKGIAEGKALTGMSKQAVIFAIGYPPTVATPDTTSDRWLYWSTKNSTFVIYFANGLVTSIEVGAPTKVT